ncbi:hypothetical protein [Embleya sp. NPDC020630]|uniref:hypothetical protein n=1 Tax=Embleya sp. NPDC020630 TaxID=3363979 RepID=UPI0037A98531
MSDTPDSFGDLSITGSGIPMKSIVVGSRRLESGVGKHIRVGALAAWMREHLGCAITLPPLLEDTTIDRLAVFIASTGTNSQTRRSFEFDARLAASEIGTGLHLEHMHVGYATGGMVSVGVRVGLELSGDNPKTVHFEGEVDTDGSGWKISADWSSDGGPGVSLAAVAEALGVDR